MIKPTGPSPPISTPSYRLCATDIVRFTLKPTLRNASCCNLDVVNGGTGLRLRSLRCTDLTTTGADLRRFLIASASSPLRISKSLPILRPSTAARRATICGGESASSLDSMLQYSSGLNLRTSCSRSQIKRTATLCTRPADNPRFTFFQRIGLIWYPTKRSRMRRACCDSNFFKSRSRGLARASCTPFFVISWINTRRILSLGFFNSLAICQAMASPSRSGSGARYTVSASCAAEVMSLRIFSLPGIVTYWGSNPLSTSTPRELAGKSLTCPFEARTS